MKLDWNMSRKPKVHWTTVSAIEQGNERAQRRIATSLSFPSYSVYVVAR